MATMTDNVRERLVAGDRAGREIRRIYGDLPVVDAERDVPVFITEEDVAKAHGKEKDEAGCVFAQACIRSFKASVVLIWRSVAYVDLPDQFGNRRVERFTLGPGMRDLIEAFDRGEGVIPKGGFLLKAPAPSYRMDSLAKRASSVEADRRRRERRKLIGERLEAAEDGIGQGKGAYRDRPLVLDLSVRSGQGRVHFAKVKPKAK